jgi:hypothetical protein
MKSYGRWIVALWLLTGALTSAWAAEQRAVVQADRVNVRGKASMVGEVITQLREGEEVIVLEEIPVAAPKQGEPNRWLRIRLPSNTPVWVFAPYIDPDHSTVNAGRLNLRGGPGENYSVLGRIERGTTVKPIRVEGNWMEIEAPDAAAAYVAASLLRITGPAVQDPAGVEPTPSAEAPAVAETKPPTGETPATEPAPTTETAETQPTPAPVVVDDETPVAAAPTTGPDAASTREAGATTRPVEEEPAPEEPPRRVVSREGRVIISRSIQAPTEYALESLHTRRTINYIHSEDLGVNLKVYAGRKVIVTGEELIDRRWTNTPIIEVESLRLVP